MILVFAVAEVHAFEQLVGDVGVAGGGHESREPVQAREESILNRARFDVPRPAGDARHSEATFADSAFCVLNGVCRHPAR